MKQLQVAFGAVAVAGGMLVAGCSLMGKAGPVTEAGVKAVHYSPASTGLPTTRIWKSQIAFGDVNGDGLPDMGTVSRLADGPWIWVGDGHGDWRSFADGLPREPFCGGGMDFADINKDGKMDVVLGDHCKGVFAFTGDGEGHWKSASSGLPTIGAEDVAAGDFDNDGCPDIVSVAQGEEGVRAFKGNCKGVWTESSDGLALTDWGNSVVLADVNADGNLDVVAAYAAGPRVWLGDGKGAWQAASTGLPAPEVRGLYWGIAAGDLNADGRLDIVAGSQMPPQPENCGAPATPACGSWTRFARWTGFLKRYVAADPCGRPATPVCSGGGLEVFLQQADGTWKESMQGIGPMNTLGVAIGDVNNDGHADVVAVGKTALKEIGGVYGVFPYLGDGAGHWRLDAETGLPLTGRMRTWGVGLADVNRDGVLDVGVAFGDVVAPAWKSGGKEGAPRRGRFGSIEVWTGRVE